MSDWQRTCLIIAIIASPVLLWNISRKADEAVALLREIANHLRLLNDRRN